jgi:hypothetical protein
MIFSRKISQIWLFPAIPLSGYGIYREILILIGQFLPPLRGKVRMGYKPGRLVTDQTGLIGNTFKLILEVLSDVLEKDECAM